MKFDMLGLTRCTFDEPLGIHLGTDDLMDLLVKAGFASLRREDQYEARRCFSELGIFPEHATIERQEVESIVRNLFCNPGTTLRIKVASGKPAESFLS